MPKFSVIIPVYNAEKYLDKCIDTVVKQTYRDFEMILIDDGSKDNSGMMCDEYAKKDDRIKVIHQKNSGAATARNVGIKNTRGDYVVFIDSDDWIEVNMLEKLNDIIENNQADCIIYNLENLTENKIIAGANLVKTMIEIIRSEVINPPWNKIYKRNIIEKYKIQFDESLRIGEDILFCFEYLSKVETIYLFNEKLYNYVIDNDDSVTRKYKIYKYEQMMFVNNKIKEYLRIYNNETILECEKFMRLKNIFSCFMDLSHKDCKYSKKEKIDFIKKVKKENKIVIKKLGVKMYLASLLYLIMPAQLLLSVSRIVSKRRDEKFKEHQAEYDKKILN